MLRYIAIVGLVILFAAARTSVRGADRVRVHAPARTFFMLPFWIGVERRFYEAQGLQVEPIVMASPIAVAALSKGEIDFLTTGDSAANAIVRGFKFRIIYLYGSRAIGGQ